MKTFLTDIANTKQSTLLKIRERGNLIYWRLYFDQELIPSEQSSEEDINTTNTTNIESWQACFIPAEGEIESISPNPPVWESFEKHLNGLGATKIQSIKEEFDTFIKDADPSFFIIN